jgi:hypothetical protein
MVCEAKCLKHGRGHYGGGDVAITLWENQETPSMMEIHFGYYMMEHMTAAPKETHRCQGGRNTLVIMTIESVDFVM